MAQQSPMQDRTRVSPADSQPWWRHPLVWMVIAGPAIVVVASFATLWLAISTPDPLIRQDASPGKTHLPAMSGRNHAATPANLVPAPKP